jgi:hypothetical protein
MKSLIPFVGLISSLTTLAVLITFFASRLVTMKKVLRWVAIYSAISFTTDLLLQIQPQSSNFFLLFTFTLLEYSCFAWIFYMLLGKQVNKKVVMVGSLVFMGMVALTLSNLENQHFDNINTGTEAILIIVYSILFFSEKLNIDNLEPIFDNPGSFIVVACLFYLAGNLFLFITSEEQSISTWVINSLFNLIRNIFFLIAIRKCVKIQKPVGMLSLT